MKPIAGRTLRGIHEESDGALPDYIIWHIFVGLLDALESMHGEGVAHGDVRMENVMLNPDPEQRPDPSVPRVTTPISCASTSHNPHSALILENMGTIRRACSKSWRSWWGDGWK